VNIADSSTDNRLDRVIIRRSTGPDRTVPSSKSASRTTARLTPRAEYGRNLGFPNLARAMAARNLIRELSRNKYGDDMLIDC
jgi:hypothetical protein